LQTEQTDNRGGPVQYGTAITDKCVYGWIDKCVHGWIDKCVYGYSNLAGDGHW
jgi:hypothetical protein